MTKKVKCLYCKQDIDLTETYDGSFVKDKTHYCHCKCFIKEKTSLKEKEWTEQQCENYLNELRSSTAIIVRDNKYTKLFYEWYCSFYEVAVVPTRSINALNQVLNGERDNLSVPIPIYELYDMFIRKNDELKVINQNLIKKKLLRGERYNADILFKYDLSVIVNKYNDYKEWKREIQEQKVLSKRRIEEKRNGINYDLFKNYHLDDKNNLIDISDMLEDV